MAHQPNAAPLLSFDDRTASDFHRDSRTAKLVGIQKINRRSAQHLYSVRIRVLNTEDGSIMAVKRFS
jgi:hypothetical protein